MDDIAFSLGSLRTCSWVKGTCSGCLGPSSHLSIQHKVLEAEEQLALTGVRE